jgi:membrane associated rhomboid family serine protease
MIPDKPKGKQKVTLRIPSVPPLFTYALLVTLLVVALAHFTAPPDADMVLNRLGLEGNAVLEGGQYWRIITALLLTATPAEPGLLSGVFGGFLLLVTLYTLYTVGIEMEKLWGTPRAILVYTLGGASGAAITLLTVPLGLLEPNLPLSAATAGILALIGAEMVYLYKHRRLYRKMAPQRQAFLLVIVLVNLILSAFSARTDFIGAFFALIGGGVLAAFISPYMLPRQHPDDPDALLAEDINPLSRRPIPVTIYTMAVMLVLAIAINLPQG